MTIFKNDVNSGDDNQSEGIQSYRELLVGDGKKFKDEEDLAKGKYEADQFIERLLKEKEEMRKDMEARLNLEELVSKLNSRTADTSNSNTQNTNERSNVDSKDTEELDINAIVEQAIQKKNVELTRQTNVRTVQEELRKTWGPDYVNILQKKVKELEVSPEFIDDAAARSPKAVLSLLGVNQENTRKQEDNNYSPPKTQLNSVSSTFNNGNTKLKDHYTKMRRENPKQYWSPSVQQEIFSLVESGKLEL